MLLVSIILIYIVQLFFFEQLDKEIVLSATGRSAGEITIAYNIFLISIFLSGPYYIYLTGKDNDVEIYGEKSISRWNYFCLLILPMCALILLCVSFGIHCEFRSCFNIETPLYLTVLIGGICYCLTFVILALYLFYGIMHKILCPISKPDIQQNVP